MVQHNDLPFLRLSKIRRLKSQYRHQLRLIKKIFFFKCEILYFFKQPFQHLCILWVNSKISKQKYYEKINFRYQNFSGHGGLVSIQL